MTDRGDYQISADDVIAVIRQLAAQGDLPSDLARAILTPATTLEGLGLDSLAELMLLSALDEIRGVYVPDHAIFPGMTIEALAALGKAKSLVA